MSVVARKRKNSTVHWIEFTWQGKRVWERVGTDRREAVRLERQRRAEVKAGTYVPRAQSKATTVGQYARGWLDSRTNRTASDDRRWVEDYVLSREWFAALAIIDVRPRHIGQLVGELKKTVGKKTAKLLSGKSVSNIYGAVRTMFRDARIAELTTSDPCALPPGTISRKVKTKRVPYSAADVRALTSETLPPEERVFNALAFFTGCREGEICGRRFWNWDRNPRPLGSLLVDTQYNDQPLKTDDAAADHPRFVPVHPELARILEWWWAQGFELVHCRPPTKLDFILPHRKTLEAHTKSSAYKMWRRSLLAAGVGNLSLHSIRHTFISLCRRGGAQKDVVEKITHNATGDIVDAYTTWDWAPLCEAVLCLNVDANVDKIVKPSRKEVEAPGIEPSAGSREKPSRDVYLTHNVLIA
jgi:integrase